MKNEFDIKEITMHGRVRAYCTMGNGYFSADVTMNVKNPTNIPDYIDVDDKIASYDGKKLILEELASGIASDIADMTGGLVTVTLRCDDALHSPVEIIAQKVGA